MVAIALITKTDRPVGRLTAALVVLVGGAMAAMAMPRILTETALLVFSQRDAAVFAAAVEDWHWAWLSERPALAAGHALVVAGDPAAAVPLLRRGLAAAPGRSESWTALAYAQNAADGPSPAAARALRLSILTGPFDLQSTAYRVDMGLHLWEAFDDADRTAFRELVRTQWQWGPGRLTEIVVRRGGERIVRAALADRPQDVAEFDRRCLMLDRQCRP